jgi:3-oxoacyl-ACP reductase-like protein
VVLTPGQQRAVFVVVVIVLAALGYFLVIPSLHHNRSQAATTPSPAATTAAPSTPPPAPTATAAPATAGGSGGVDIYAWLPFTQQDLAAAAAVTIRFTVAYDTYNYTESATTYVNTMSGLITGQLASTLQAAYSTPGTAKLRTSEQQVSTGTAQINSLRAFGQTSITFVVDARQHLVTSRGTSDGSPQYFVTVTGSGTSWRVNDIEFSNAGNS